jgi:hypothetical protein
MISFSTLEDAWGVNMQSQNNVKSSKKNKVVDPICELYGKRYSKVSKPYSSAQPMSEGLNNSEKYSKNEYSSNMKNRKKNNTNSSNHKEYYPIELDEYSSFASAKEMDSQDDDDYLTNALEDMDNNQIENSATELNSKFNNDVFDNEVENDYNEFKDDDADNDEIPQRVAQKTIIKKNKKKLNNTIDEKYLDLGLYISSGILLIFMMEQILRLGMKMKM